MVALFNFILCLCCWLFSCYSCLLFGIALVAGFVFCDLLL